MPEFFEKKFPIVVCKIEITKFQNNKVGKITINSNDQLHRQKNERKEKYFYRPYRLTSRALHSQD